MPKMAKTTTSNEVTEVVKETVTNNETTENNSSEIEALKKANADLSAQMAQLMSLVQQLSQPVVQEKATVPAEVEADVVDDLKAKYSFDVVPEEVHPNKQILVMSLCYGSLNLVDDTNKTVLRFSKYGESKPVLYSTLLNIVNSNRHFAEVGKFYILDTNAVYHLGLSEYYKNLIPKEIIDNILNYPMNVIENIMSFIDDSQKEVLIKTLTEKLYHDERNTDTNKVIFIGKLCNTDIMAKANEMKKYQNIK